MAKIPEEKYKGSVLRGRDLKDSTVSTIKEVGTVIFNEGKDDEREQYQITVEGDEATGSVALNMKNLRILVEALGDDTDKWIDKKVRLTPVPSQMPNGTPTTSIAITVPKK